MQLGALSSGRKGPQCLRLGLRQEKCSPSYGILCKLSGEAIWEPSVFKADRVPEDGVGCNRRLMSVECGLFLHDCKSLFPSYASAFPLPEGLSQSMDLHSRHNLGQVHVSSHKAAVYQHARASICELTGKS